MVVEGGIVVTESSRGKLWRLLCFLGWSEAFVGATLAVIVYRPTSSLSTYLPSSEHHLLHVFYAELIVGLTSAVVAVQGVLVSQAGLHNPLMKSTARAFNTWLILGITLVFSLVVALIVIPPAVETGQDEILEIMKSGIGSYLSSLEWKTSLDKLHQHFQCCGVSSISDWYTTRWIPIRSFRPEVADLQDVLAEDGTLGARVVPATCCNPAVRLPCFHDTLQQNSSPADPRTVLHPETVFTRGCGYLVVDPAVSTVGLFQVLVIIILLLQTGQLVIGRYLYTGARTVAKSVEYNDRCSRARSRIHYSPRMNSYSSDTCRTSPTRCFDGQGTRRRKFNIFSRKRTETSQTSVVKSHVRKIGEAIKTVSRSMLSAITGRLPWGSSKNSSWDETFSDRGRWSPRSVNRRNPENIERTPRWHSRMTEAPRKRIVSLYDAGQKEMAKLLSIFPVVDTEAYASLQDGLCSSDGRSKMARTISIKTNVNDEIRSTNSSADISPKLLQEMKKSKKYDELDLLNLNL